MGATSVRKVEIAAIFARKVAIGAILGPVEGEAADGLGARAVGWGLGALGLPVSSFQWFTKYSLESS